jgi:hypothetical protein
VSKQDRTYTRTASELEQKLNYNKRFAEILGIATDAQDAANKAVEAVANLDTDLTSEEIFNILTDNSKDQGIYRENGKIYVNASFIKSGFISADIIKAGKIRSLDFEIIDVEKLYPGDTLYPDSIYPNTGDDITRGIEIDFSAGYIRGAFSYDVTDELARRISALEKAVFNT